MTLTDFLLARIAEDEAEVQNALALHGSGTTWRLGHALDPARVLAECEAKRRIVGRHRQSFDICAGDCAMRETSPCPTLRLLALPYAGHPDYREEWKL